jgi:chromosome segregation ATPase
MNLSEKNNFHNNLENELQNKEYQEQPVEDISLTKENILTQIHYLEQKIVEERDKLLNQIREKEEQKISLEMRLETIQNNIDNRKKMFEKELEQLKNSISKDLEQMNNSYNIEIRQWQKKLKQKQDELEQLRNKSVFEEAQQKMLTDKQNQSAKNEIENINSQLQSLQRQLEEEKNIFPRYTDLDEKEIAERNFIHGMQEAVNDTYNGSESRLPSEKRNKKY